MARIFIINDLSQSQPWLHYLLVANKARLAKHGIELAPFNPWSADNISHHCHLWMPQAEGEPPAEWIEEQWLNMAQTLNGRRDILVLAHTPWLEAHKYFYATLSRKLAGHEAKYLGIVGNPLVSVEMRHRESVIPLDSGTADFYSRSYMGYDNLWEAAINFAGTNNALAIPNHAKDVASGPNPQIIEEVCQFLGFPELEQPASIPPDALFFRSHDARILTRAKSVRFNGWPYLDEGKYARILSELDSTWNEDIVTPAALRENMASVLKTMGKRHIRGLSFPFPAAPEILAANSAVPVDRHLNPEQAAMFAKDLPPDMAEVLRQRLAQDEFLLSANQKIFNSALCALPKNDFASLGEPLPPVEVSVLTMTYNHERYIGQCIDGVLGQQTSFPVRHIIVDHCSNDDTPQIVAEYARKNPSIQPVLLSRRVHPENVTGLFLRCRTRYAALCDGDDYFTDMAKLQKQVDFLEKHTDCALCFHPVAVIFEDGTPPFRFPPLNELPRGVKEKYYLADLFKGNFIQTDSVVYRWRFQEGLPDWFRADLCPGDWYWHMLHAELGKIGFIPEIMSVYRRHSQALFKDAFKNAQEHRRRHGIAELEAYKTYNDHFKNRYFGSFSSLANGVFASFFQIAENEGNRTLLDYAVSRFPNFALEFFKSLNRIISSNPPKRQKRQSAYE